MAPGERAGSRKEEADGVTPAGFFSGWLAAWLVMIE
jgi:hypothetical protein